MNEEIKKNQKLWDQWTNINIKSKFYDLPSFLNGKNTLNEIEKDEIGLVEGLSVLHLQCHFGMDTISQARMGAKVSGVDISEVAITKAKELAKQLKFKVDFILSDVYDLKKWIRKKYDLAFASYGVISWLPDLNTWADIISWCLKPGGTFYLVDFHPILWMLDDQLTHIQYPYDSAGSPLKFENVPSYAEPDIPLSNQEFNWHHGIGKVVNSLIQSRLQIEFLNEHFFSPYPVFSDMEEIEEGKWIHVHKKQKIPYLFSVKAKKY